jgi:hypothetical protein
LWKIGAGRTLILFDLHGGILFLFDLHGGPVAAAGMTSGRCF